MCYLISVLIQYTGISIKLTQNLLLSLTKCDTELLTMRLLSDYRDLALLLSDPRAMPILV